MLSLNTFEKLLTFGYQARPIIFISHNLGTLLVQQVERTVYNSLKLEAEPNRCL